MTEENEWLYSGDTGERFTLFLIGNKNMSLENGGAKDVNGGECPGDDHEGGGSSRKGGGRGLRFRVTTPNCGTAEVDSTTFGVKPWKRPRGPISADIAFLLVGRVPAIVFDLSSFGYKQQDNDSA